MRTELGEIFKLNTFLLNCVCFIISINHTLFIKLNLTIKILYVFFSKTLQLFKKCPKTHLFHELLNRLNPVNALSLINFLCRLYLFEQSVFQHSFCILSSKYQKYQEKSPYNSCAISLLKLRGFHFWVKYSIKKRSSYVSIDRKSVLKHV